MHIEVCEMRPHDFDDVVALWQGNVQSGFPGGDDENALGAFLARTRGLNLVARHEQKLVGLVVCLGRSISGAQCQAVIDPVLNPDCVAKTLVGKAMQKLTAAVGKCQLHILNQEMDHEFWHAAQWTFGEAALTSDHVFRNHDPAAHIKLPATTVEPIETVELEPAVDAVESVSAIHEVEAATSEVA